MIGKIFLGALYATVRSVSSDEPFHEVANLSTFLYQHWRSETQAPVRIILLIKAGVSTVVHTTEA